MIIMTTDVMALGVALLIMMCALGYCVMKLCSLIDASNRIVQSTEMGAGEQILVQRVADTSRGLQRNGMEVHPIGYIPMNAYAGRRVTKSFSKSSFWQFYY